MGLLVWGVFFSEAQAQVAVPRIVPIAPSVLDPLLWQPLGSFVPLNPGAVTWGAPRRVGAGTLSVNSEETAINPGFPLHIKGGYAGGMFPGDKFAFAFQGAKLLDKTSIPKQVDWNTQSFALGLRMNPNVTIGLGSFRGKNSLETNVLSYASSELGATVMFKERFYAGVAMGSESIDSALNGKQKRNLRKYGIGYRKGGRVLLHGEVFREFRNSAPGLIDNSGNVIPEFTAIQRSGVVMEFAFRSIVGAATWEHLRLNDLQRNTAGTSFSGGWVMWKGGTAVMYHLENMKSTNSLTLEKFNTKTQSVVATYQF